MLNEIIKNIALMCYKIFRTNMKKNKRQSDRRINMWLSKRRKFCSFAVTSQTKSPINESLKKAVK